MAPAVESVCTDWWWSRLGLKNAGWGGSVDWARIGIDDGVGMGVLAWAEQIGGEHGSGKEWQGRGIEELRWCLGCS
jgi:hypothetical protein